MYLLINALSTHNTLDVVISSTLTMKVSMTKLCNLISSG